MPLQIQITIEVALLLLFKRHWQHRSDSYMRRSLREYVAALRYIRQK